MEELDAAAVAAQSELSLPGEREPGEGTFVADARFRESKYSCCDCASTLAMMSVSSQSVRPNMDGGKWLRKEAVSIREKPSSCSCKCAPEDGCCRLSRELDRPELPALGLSSLPSPAWVTVSVWSKSA